MLSRPPAYPIAGNNAHMADGSGCADEAHRTGSFGCLPYLKKLSVEDSDRLCPIITLAIGSCLFGIKSRVMCQGPLCICLFRRREVHEIGLGTAYLTG